MLYCLFTSAIFRKSVLDELSGTAKFKVIDESVGLLIIETSSRHLQHVAEGLTFTYSAFPLVHKAKISKARYLQTILAAIKATKVDKKSALKLECVDINNKEGYSAKDIEVKTGQALEKEGFNINITEPELLAYVVMLNGICYSGVVDYESLRQKFVNPLRYYHTKKEVSRSELKLREAFDEFGIKEKGIAIDLGAAPGGWSAFLAKKGFKVIAIDKAGLDAAAIAAKGIKLKVVSSSRKMGLGRLFKDADIIHIKNDSKNALPMLRAKNIDLLVDDMNVDAKATASAVRSYLKFLKSGAEMIITVKCITKYAPRAIATAKREIGKYAEIKRMKVLPSNRQEITLFAKHK